MEQTRDILDQVQREREREEGRELLLLRCGVHVSRLESIGFQSHLVRVSVGASGQAGTRIRSQFEAQQKCVAAL